MPHTASNLLVHFIFSTKQRFPLIKPEIASDLHAYFGGIIRQIGGKALIINGTADHVHLLVRVPTTHSIADIARVIKANSGSAGKRVMVLSALASPAQVPYKTTFCASASIIGTSHFKRSTWHF